MNPFLLKPLKKVQPAVTNTKNSSQEHRPSKYLNANIAKNPKIVAAEKKNVDTQKLRNPSPRDKNQNNVNNINLIHLNKPIKEDDKKKNQVTNVQNNTNVQMNNKEREIIKDNNNIKKFSNDLKIDKNIKFSYQNKTDKLIFNNNDEILEYIKNQIKDGKIKNIYQRLEIKKSEFTGFTITKKKQGYTIYEIEIEDDIKKINEAIKKQKVEINKKPIELKYVFNKDEEVVPKLNPIKKDPEIKEKKAFITDNKNPENYIQAMKNKTMEREIENVKKDKINYEIKNLQNKIQKHKEELKNEENNKKENDKKFNVRSSKINNATNQLIDNTNRTKRRDSDLKFKVNPKKEEENIPAITSPNLNEKNDKKKSTIEENQRRVSRAYIRFKKAFSSNKNKEEDTGPGNSDKIKSLAAILQEHIIKPLAEIEEENVSMKPRAGSVECRAVKNEGMAEILENVPVQRKNVKKPKNINFGE